MNKLKSVSFDSRSDGSIITLTYPIHIGEGVGQVKREFFGLPGFLIQEKAGEGWKHVYEGLADTGNLVKLGRHESVLEVVHREFEAFRRWDKAQENPTLAISRGRPKKVANGATVAIFMGEETLALAKALGGGNVSEGVRKALEQVAAQESPGTPPANG